MPEHSQSGQGPVETGSDDWEMPGVDANAGSSTWLPNDLSIVDTNLSRH